MNRLVKFLNFFPKNSMNKFLWANGYIVVRQIGELIILQPLELPTVLRPVVQVLNPTIPWFQISLWDLNME